MVATPLMIAPLNCSAPESVAIVTLWGMAASLLVNVIPNGTSAGPVIERGEKRKSRASMPRTTGAAVGLAVGMAVADGLTVGLGIGLAVGVGGGVGRGVGRGVGFRVGAAVAARLGVAPDAAVGRGVATGDAVALGELVGEGRPVGAAVGAALTAAVDADADDVAEVTGESVKVGPGADPPHATADRQMTTSNGTAAPCGRVRDTGIAAL